MLPPGVRIKENSWIARIAAWKLGVRGVAMVLGNTIHLYHTSATAFLNSPRWLRHELCHVRQFREHGFWLFLVKYLWESIRHGYYNNKYEIEARAAEHTLEDDLLNNF
jgi:hypothetical protein